MLAVLAVQTRGAGWGRRGQQRAAPQPGPQRSGPLLPRGAARSPTSEQGCGPRPLLSPGQPAQAPMLTNPAVGGTALQGAPWVLSAHLSSSPQVPGTPPGGLPIHPGRGGPDRWAGLTLQAAGTRPARATAALPVDGVTGSPVEAGAGLATVVPVGESWARCRTEGGQGPGTQTLAAAAGQAARSRGLLWSPFLWPGHPSG